MKKKNFLLELGTEELPSKLLFNLCRSFLDNVIFELNFYNINYKKLYWYATARRIAVKIYQMNENQNDYFIKKIGPSLKNSLDPFGNFTNEVKEWCNKDGIEIDKIKKNIITKQERLLYVEKMKGKKVNTLLFEIIHQAIKKIKIFRTMRWGSNNKFIRPIRTVTMMLDNEIIPGEIFGLKNNNVIYGHRFMGKQRINISHVNQYPDILMKEGFVIADYEKRRKKILLGIKEKSNSVNGTVYINKILLEEVTALVEWPVVHIANFEKDFLMIPKKILVYIFEKNRKFFPVYNSKNELLPYFIFITNIESKKIKEIIYYNEKFLNLYLKDIKYLLKIDQSETLEKKLPLLNSVIFQKKLGTLLEKSYRIARLSILIASKIGANIKKAYRAGLLAKCDLTTNMVSEFGEMQGIIGMYYALHDGESKTVALAIKEQYNPKFFNDEIPTNLVSCAVSISDKIDTITGIFTVRKEKKSGAGDPFALRRISLGILRIIIEKRLPLDLKILIKKSFSLYKRKLIYTTNIVEDISNFFLDRLFYWYRKKGYSKEIINSVLFCYPTHLMDFDSRINAVNYFVTLKESKDLILLSKRISNILDKSNCSIYNYVNLTLLNNPEEIKLMKFLTFFLKNEIDPLFHSGCYKEVLIKLVQLKKPIDDFFNKVFIMTENEDIRINRLTILYQLKKTFLKVADISILNKI